MQWKGHMTGLVFSIIFVGSCFTNKFVLSVLKFTFPTLFQGWQTLVGAVLLLLSGRLGWVELSRISRSAVVSWLPGSLMFLGSIYAGSRALSRMAVPYFFTVQNASHVVSYLLLRVVHREQKTSWSKLSSMCIMFFSAINLPIHNPGFDLNTYGWAVCHLACVGAYRVFRIRFKSIQLSVFDQQYINYMFSICLLALAAHPTGDLFAAWEFPLLASYTFHWGCCASALLGFLLLLATVKLKSGLSLEESRTWTFLSKLAAVTLSPLAFPLDPNIPSFACVLFSLVGEALLVYSDMDTKA
ncbi:transmembrane protein 241 isoform X1 [Gadus chalcogrammus]|uniref:transmembrane protein 241 isoform X1 n=1 Tax=Gadus chalcogrammus TaxID=1042646 RepID=UPI0024C488AC|nr:transmembrane protein 241 isoform X1 [Gadus chalcogrammus]